MLFWKRREVYMGVSAEEYNAIRKKLAAAGIRYDMKGVSRFGGDLGGSRSLAGVMSSRTEYMILYYVYVDKKDYDRAMAIINTK